MSAFYTTSQGGILQSDERQAEDRAIGRKVSFFLTFQSE